MTEYELTYLTIETRSLIMAYLTFWMTASTSIVLIGYFLGSSINTKVKSSLIFLYLFISIATISGYLQAFSETFEYVSAIAQLRNASEVALLGPVTGYIGTLIYIAGSIGALIYFINQTKRGAKGA